MESGRRHSLRGDTEQDHVGLCCPIRTLAFTLSEMENHVTYFNKVILVALLRKGCRGAKAKQEGELGSQR